jgi:hypothetical protein
MHLVLRYGEELVIQNLVGGISTAIIVLQFPERRGITRANKRKVSTLKIQANPINQNINTRFAQSSTTTSMLTPTMQ